VAVIAAIALGTLYFLNWWLLALWVSVLAGIVGGKVFLFQARWLRRFYLVVLLYLVSLLLVWIVPNTFIRSALPGEVELLARYGLPLLFVVMMAIPAETDTAETPQVVDFFYAAMIVLLLIALALGSFAFMTVGRVDYITALSLSMLIIAGVLLLLSFAWNPRVGFGGLSVYFSRYLLSIGLPFERWLYFLAELSQLETKPERFMKEACAGLARLPWVSGGFWHTSASRATSARSPRIRSSSPTRRSTCGSSRSCRSARRWSGTSSCSGSCSANSTWPSSASRSSSSRPTCRRSTRPARA